MALIKEYFNLTEKYIKEYGPNTIVLMQVGAFFEVYGYAENKDAPVSGSELNLFCSICELAKADKIAGSVIMAGFRDYSLERYTKKLLDAGITVPVIVQDQQSCGTTRSLQCIYSPGTHFSSETTNSAELSNNISCVWVDKMKRGIVLGMTNIDIVTGKASIFETGCENFHNPTTYDELERFITSYRPSEVIIITNMSSAELEDVIQFANISNTTKTIHRVLLQNDEDDGHGHGFTVSEQSNSNSNLNSNSNSNSNSNNTPLSSNQIKAKKCVKQIFQREILKTYYPENLSVETYMTYEIATQSLVYLLNFIYEHNPSLVSKINEPVFENKSDRVILANNSLKQLNIIDDSNYTGKLSSVSRFLNNCVTTIGSRKCKHTILNPTFNEAILQADYDITEYILEKDNDTITAWRERLSGIKDIEKFLRQIVLRKIPPQSLYFLYTNLKTIAALYDEISADEPIISYAQKALSDKKMALPPPHVSGICVAVGTLLDATFYMDMCREMSEMKIERNFIVNGVNAALDAVVNDYENNRKRLETITAYLNGIIENGERKSSSLNLASHAAKKKYSNDLKKTTTKRSGGEINYNEDLYNSYNNNKYDDYVDETTFADPDSNDVNNGFVKIHETEKMGISLQTTKRRGRLLEENLKKETTASVELSYTLYQQKHTFAFQFREIVLHTATGSNSGITSPQINQLCASVVHLRNKMITMVGNCYNEFVISLQKHLKDLELVADFVGIIDNLQNKAYVAKKYKYCKPEIAEADAEAETNVEASSSSSSLSSSSSSFVTAIGLRHALIERLNTEEVYVTNDISLSQSHKSSRGILLYGTNAVGKTSLIRALGISVIMAQSGFYVPCQRFIYKPYHTIFTRILGNDNLFKGMSTFMVEMSELRVILRMATENSLILGDELCSGTEIESAISIFVSGIKRLHDIRASFIFATHLHQITDYDEIRNMTHLVMKHLQVVYDKEKDVLMFDRKLKDGPGASMYGLEVCKYLHLPDDFLEYANEIRLKYCGNKDVSILNSAGSSTYNAKKVRRMCEFCNDKVATEVHHLQHQQFADENNYIEHIHKNHPANLAGICNECHDNIHHCQKQHRRVKTTEGTKIVEDATLPCVKKKIVKKKTALQ